MTRGRRGRPLSRRAVLRALGALGAAASGLAGPRQGAAEPARLGVHESARAAMQRVFGTRTVRDGAGIVRLELPAIAENGALVPVSVDVASPMTPANHVKTIYLVAEGNRIPVVTRVTLSLESGQASIGLTIRLGETAGVRAIVEQSDGTLLGVRREVKVTIGGCGG